MSAMSSIFAVDEKDLPWADYRAGADEGAPRIRFKALTGRERGVPPMQYVEYPPGHVDSMHHHETGEVVIITAGELRVGDLVGGPGSAIYVPRDLEYAFESGAEGARFFRIVVP